MASGFIFKHLRTAGTLEGLYQDYCLQVRQSLICQPNGRRWFARVIEEAPGLMRQSHPDLYADLDSRPRRGFQGISTASSPAAYRDGYRAHERSEARAVPGRFECNSEDWLKGYDDSAIAQEGADQF